MASHTLAWLLAAAIVAAIELAPTEDQPKHCVTATITRIVDGDTYVADVALPLDVTLRRQHIRLFGVDTPELRAGDPLQRKKAIAALIWAKRHLLHRRVALELHGRDSFGRVLARVFVDGQDVGQRLLEEELATPWKR